MMTPAGVWEKWIYMIKISVSMSIPMVHHVRSRTMCKMRGSVKIQSVRAPEQNGHLM